MPRSQITHRWRAKYLAATPPLLKDVAILILETGVRAGDGADLAWQNVHLEPAVHAQRGHIAICCGKSKNTAESQSDRSRRRKVEGKESGRELALGVSRRKSGSADSRQFSGSPA
jgi:hypothetical protein